LGKHSIQLCLEQHPRIRRKPEFQLDLDHATASF
jgi:hypothetical protein